jgi:hypothetical protein
MAARRARFEGAGEVNKEARAAISAAFDAA